MVCNIFRLFRVSLKNKNTYESRMKKGKNAKEMHFIGVKCRLFIGNRVERFGVND